MDVEKKIQELWDFTRSHAICSLRRKEDGEDVIQECLMKYFIIAQTWDKPEREFVPYCKDSARNLVRDFIRRNQVRNQGKSHPCLHERIVTINLERLDAQIILEQIKRCLSDRSKLVLDALAEGIEPREIAQLSGISRSSVYRVIEEASEAVIQNQK